VCCACGTSLRLHFGHRNGISHMFFLPEADHVSHSSAIGDDGVIGNMAVTSLRRNATEAAASFPSIVTNFCAMSCAPFLLLLASCFRSGPSAMLRQQNKEHAYCASGFSGLALVRPLSVPAASLAFW